MSDQQQAATEPDRTDASAELSYEQARDELAEVVKKLEAGGITLEESLTLWERGEELARICTERLEGARARLERATGEPASGRSGTSSTGSR